MCRNSTTKAKEDVFARSLHWQWPKQKFIIRPNIQVQDVMTDCFSSKRNNKAKKWFNCIYARTSESNFGEWNSMETEQKSIKRNKNSFKTRMHCAKHAINQSNCKIMHDDDDGRRKSKNECTINAMWRSRCWRSVPILLTSCQRRMR